MENASKAIIIAGAALIGILIISIGVSLWVKSSNFSKQTEEKIKTQQLNEFNTKFEKYNGKEITAHDARTIVSYANEFNLKYSTNLDNPEINVEYKGKYRRDMIKWSEEEWIRFFNDSSATKDNPDVKKYKCKIEEPKSKDIIRKITISES